MRKEKREKKIERSVRVEGRQTVVAELLSVDAGRRAELRARRLQHIQQLCWNAGMRECGNAGGGCGLFYICFYRKLAAFKF